MKKTTRYKTVRSKEEWKSLGLENSIPLEKHRWSSSKELMESAEKALSWSNMVGKRSGHRNLNVRLMTVILQNLFHAYHADKKKFCSYSRYRNDYVWIDQYNKTRFSSKALKLIDAMASAPEFALIENYAGVQFGEFKRVARMRLTPFGAKHLMTDCNITPQIAQETVSEECIVLRDKNKKDIPYKNTSKTISMRKKLTAYNELIARTRIHVRGFPEEGIERGADKEIDKIDYSKNYAVRIFNGGKWTEGGRYYRTWWINLAKEWRPMIYINGKPTSEHDYSVIHPAIAYAHEGLNIFETLGDDPYQLPGYEQFPQMRDLAKLILNTALNATTKAIAVSSVNEEIHINSPADYQWFKASGLKVKDLLKTIIERHKPIEDWLGGNRSTYFQYIDSQIAEAVLNAMTTKKIPVLVVHDSFVCEADQEDQLLEAMRKAFKAILSRIAKKEDVIYSKIKSVGVPESSWKVFLAAKDRLRLTDFHSLMELVGQGPVDPLSIEANDKAMREALQED